MGNLGSETASSILRMPQKVFAKVGVIAEKEGRSRNAQIQYFVQRGIAKYEAEHGKVKVEED